MVPLPGREHGNARFVPADKRARSALGRARRPSMDPLLASLPLFSLAACGGGAAPATPGQTPAVAPPSLEPSVLPVVSADTEGTVSGNVLPAANRSGPAAATVTTVAVAGGANGTVGVPLVTPLGSLTLNADGGYVFGVANNDAVRSLPAGVAQSVAIDFTVRNSAGSAASTITLSVAGINDAPVATADEVAAPTTITGPITGNLLANDSDVDRGTTLTVVRIVAQGAQAGVAQAPQAALTASGTFGAVTAQSDGSFSYALDAADPDFVALRAGETAVDRFSYTISDGQGGTATATLAITVTGVNEPPIGPMAVVNTIASAADSSFSFNILSGASAAGLELVSLVPAGAPAPSGPSLFVTSYPYNLQPGGIGVHTLRGQPDGAISYPNAGYLVGAGQSFTDFFTYTVRSSDGSLYSSTLAYTVGKPAENVVNGTAGADALSAGNLDTVLNGGDGDDVIVGGAGWDTFDGGVGNDTLSGFPASDPVAAQFSGSDILKGGAGDDRIVGGTSTRDVAVFSGRRSDYRITETNGVLTVKDTNAADGDDGTDTLVGVEILSFADQNLLFPPRTSTTDQEFSRAVLVGGSTQIQTGFIFYSSYPATYEISLLSGGAVPGWLSIGADGFLKVTSPPTGAEGVHRVLTKQTVASETHYASTTLLIYSPQPGDVRPNVFNDAVYTGTAGDDRIFGMGNRDVFVGSPGADTLVGAPGGQNVSVVDYSGSPGAVRIDFVRGSASGGYAEGDVLIAIKNVVGSAFGDVFTLNSDGALTRHYNVEGGGGDDVFLVTGGGAQGTIHGQEEGFSWLEGGPGGDAFLIADRTARISYGKIVYGVALDYADSPAGVNVNLLTGNGSGGDAAGDRIRGPAALLGSAFDDVLVGSAYLRGGNGNDLLVGRAAPFSDIVGGDGNDSIFGSIDGGIYEGGAGADTITGGEGPNDTASYASSPAAVTINLGARSAAGGDAAGDVLAEIEHLVGSALSDTLTGTGAANHLDTGAAGSDQVRGLGGDDTIVVHSVGAGSLLDGGSGVDTLLLDASGVFDDYVIDLASGTGRSETSANDFVPPRDFQIIGIENVTGPSRHLLIAGDGGANVLTGTGTENILIGRGGADTLSGGAGADTLIEASDSATMVGGFGSDRLVIVASQSGVSVIASGDCAPASAGPAGTADTFIIAADGAAGSTLTAHLRVTDFEAGHDKIDVSDLRDSDGSALDWQDIVSHATFAGGTTAISLDSFLTADGRDFNGSITLDHVASLDTLSAADFVFLGGVDWTVPLPADIAIT